MQDLKTCHVCPDLGNDVSGRRFSSNAWEISGQLDQVIVKGALFFERFSLMAFIQSANDKSGMKCAHAEFNL